MKKKIVDYIITVILFIIIITFGISSLCRGMPSIGNYSMVRVLSGSMQASGINIGDTILIKTKSNYNIGDYIVFSYGDQFWFHEIVEENDEGFITKGSSNPLKDEFTVYYSNIKGAMICKANVLGNVSFRIILIVICYIFFLYNSIMELRGNFNECNEHIYKRKRRTRRISKTNNGKK